MAALTKSDTNRIRVLEDGYKVHDVWMFGPDRDKGANLKIALMEDNLKDINKKLDSILSLFTKVGIGLLIAFLVWLATVLLPQIIGHIG
jgi:hypothetical protein